MTPPPTARLGTELVGVKWNASGGGGGIGWTRDYIFAGDGSYKMTGYPAIQGTGRWTITERDGTRMHLVTTQRQVENTEREDEDVWIEFAADGSSFKWGADTYSKQPLP